MGLGGSCLYHGIKAQLGMQDCPALRWEQTRMTLHAHLLNTAAMLGQEEEPSLAASLTWWRPPVGQAVA